MKYIYLHGFTSSPDSEKGKFFTSKLNQNGLDCIAPDLNGDNFTNLLISEQLKSLSACWNDDEEYIAIGSSLGGMLALNLAEQHSNIKKVLLLAPAFNISRLWDKNVGNEYMNYWRQNGYLEIPHHAYKKNVLLHYKFVEDLNHNLIDGAFIRNFPVQIFHGLNDETIPYQGSLDYMQKNSLAFVELLNSDHSLSNSLDEIWQNSRDFLEVPNCV